MKRIDGYRSQLEADYAFQLEMRKRAGEILDYTYEPEKFWLASRMTYTPDFRLSFPDGRIEWHEVKGWHKNMRASRRGWKFCAEQHPEATWVWVWGRGTRRHREWEYEAYRTPEAHRERRGKE